jgi:hypothetical protein
MDAKWWQKLKIWATLEPGELLTVNHYKNTVANQLTAISSDKMNSGNSKMWIIVYWNWKSRPTDLNKQPLGNIVDYSSLTVSEWVIVA